MQASERKQNTSIWLALGSPGFVGLWLPSVVSGACVAAHDTAATWLMNALGASALLLSLLGSWVEHLRQHTRTTRAEIELAERALAMHAGDEGPTVRHYPKANRLSAPLGSSRLRKQPEVRFEQAIEQTRTANDYWNH